MKKFISTLLVLGGIAIALVSYAGDVVYTMWEDDGGQLWVRIQNDTAHGIKVESILIVFYNAKGKPIDQQNVPCRGDCGLSPRDTRDFGPYNPPSSTVSSRVRNVRYAVE